MFHSLYHLTDFLFLTPMKDDYRQTHCGATAEVSIREYFTQRVWWTQERTQMIEQRVIPTAYEERHKIRLDHSAMFSYLDDLKIINIIY